MDVRKGEVWTVQGHGVFMVCDVEGDNVLAVPVARDTEGMITPVEVYTTVDTTLTKADSTSVKLLNRSDFTNLHFRVTGDTFKQIIGDICTKYDITNWEKGKNFVYHMCSFVPSEFELEGVRV